MREKERVRQLKQQLRDELRQELDGYRQVEDEELYERIDRKIFEAGSQGYLPLKERLELRKSIFNSFRKLDILQQLLDDPEITEVMINGRDHIFVEAVSYTHLDVYKRQDIIYLKLIIIPVCNHGIMVR